LLEERGVRCWIAPRDVKPGASYGDEIIRGTTDQVADKPSDPNLGTAETAPADVPAYADRAEPWDKPPAAGAQAAAPAEALPAPSMDGSRYGE
jgi:hypothetical protein